MTTDIEIEVKIAIADVESLINKLQKLHFTLSCPEVFEENIVFDRGNNELKQRGHLLRLRSSGNKHTLTFKTPVANHGVDTTYKIRNEVEVVVSDFEEMKNILLALDYQIYFIYEKYRQIYERDGVKVMIDRTPIGDFMEIEGQEQDINQVAAQLQFSENDYIVDTYFSLFNQLGLTGYMQFK